MHSSRIFCYLVTATVSLGLGTVAGATTISSVTFYGSPSDPTIAVAGSGFLPEPTASGFLNGPGLGQDFGGDVTTFSISGNGAKSFTAGEDGDIVGLNNINYTDTLITFQLGSNYALLYNIQYALAQGDPYVFFLNGVEASGTVDYVASPVPEPSSLALLGTGVLGALGIVRHRRSLFRAE